MNIRILVADDFRGWQHQVRLLLQARPEWQIVCEVSDGAGAVQKAAELRPDLLILDIGLPNLNGIEAAKQIPQVSPSSKVLFLSTDNSPEVVQAAMSAGAQGYVHKARAGNDLVSAIEAILLGERFISGTLKGANSAGVPPAKATQSHEVLFYSDDEIFLNTFARFIAAALETGDVAIVIVTEAHRDSLVQRLESQGLDIDEASRQGTFIPMDVTKTLSSFMVNGIPDAGQFFEITRDLVRTAAKAGKKEQPRIVACGECAPTLWAEGNVDAAIRLEQLWDQLATTYGINTLCGYSLSSFHSEQDQTGFQRICSQHSTVHRQ